MKAWTLPFLSLLSLPALAGHRGGPDHVYASVVEVRPVVRHVVVETPRRQCWDELVYQRVPSAHPLRDAAPVIAGGMIGGVIGHELAGSHNRGALTALGAAAGAAVAYDRAERRGRFESDQFRQISVERCEIVYDRVTERRIEAYDVVYRYNGHRRLMRTHHAPRGKKIRLARRHMHL